MTMSRRRFVQGAGMAGLGLVAGCRRLPGQAPEPARVYRIGVLSAGESPGQAVSGLRDALRDLGYIEGRNIVFDLQYARESESRYPELAAAVLRLAPDVIVTRTTDITRAAKNATSIVPIVMIVNGDPVESGLVASFAHPGGNVTGLTRDIAHQLLGKRLGLLYEALPGTTRVVTIQPAGSETAELNLAETRSAADTLGLELLAIRVADPDDLARGLATATAEGAQALIMLPGSDLPVVALAAQHRLPGMFTRREYVVDGGLMAYGPNNVGLDRRAAAYVDRIFKGAKPADLPVEQPREFDFVINLKTAQALGLTIPQHVLLQATQIIQ